MTATQGYPDISTAHELLEWAHGLNPGPWREHCQTAARVARAVAERAGLNLDKAYVLGLLHDIGRYGGVNAFRHVYDGYKLMMERGFPVSARICLTHSFPVQVLESYFGGFDVPHETVEEMRRALSAIEYDDYDRLIQLCDALAAAEGVCPIEVRVVDAARRNGINEHVPAKWNATFALKRHFDELCGINILSLFAEDLRRWFDRYMS